MTQDLPQVAEPGDQAPRVFITYSHDDEPHRSLVREFAEFLMRSAGIEVTLDQWSDDQRRDWARWAMDNIAKVDYILVIASPAYKRRAEGAAPPEEGRGAQFETSLLLDNLTRDLPAQTRRIIPVVLPGRSVEEIPSFMRPYSSTHYLVSEISVDGVRELLGAIHGAPRWPPPERGPYLGNPWA
ncbi:SEFIR domain-containing protein [Actinokineospora sp. NBRC 105648]|uniref:SEFIR domain-containing protein n=1 Tax=Actinokineospora sp. NBRC 105648 TaxID=3032206 RepID=UPI0024A42713|nr:SEFIR domain-containing protein [Actinokineospora sp. NBRC 105648]GLZ39091.1 hypothetical protein Acsp05_27150 [Actinokineospora sp. NBRC 105648]